VTEAPAALPFEVRDGRGAVVLRGATEPHRPAPEPTSGLPVHVLDFSALDARGEGFTVAADGDVSHPFALGGAGYERLRRDALTFLRVQRSGVAIRDEELPGYGRPAGHAGVPPNRGDTAVGRWTGPDAERLYPGWRCDLVRDVSGGWYDAGDHGKYVVTGAVAVAWLLSAHDRALRTPGGAELPGLLDEARWELEWLLRMQVPAGDPLAGLAFHKIHDERWTPLPTLPHADPELRVLHRPSTAAALGLAAAAAQGARAFRAHDERFAVRLLAAARTAHAAARRHPALLAPAGTAAFGGGDYADDDVDDELYRAAAELLLATGEAAHLDAVLASPCHRAAVFDRDGFDWAHVAPLGRLALSTAPSALPDRERVVRSVLDAAEDLLALQAGQPWDQPYAPADGAWAWGSNGLVLANVAVMATAYDLGGDHRFRDGALRGLDYVLGRNALGRSYVTGHGTVSVRSQRSRHLARSLDPALPPPPPGTLAGGPTSIRYGFPGEERFAGLPPQQCHVDEVWSETTNDAAVNWNAALVWAASFATGEAAAEG
jgi:endoglucanase